MSVYTVYEPPLRPADALPDPARFAFVRDGFSFWAFLVAALWMLWHRMWLVLLIYVIVAAGIDAAMYYAGVPRAAVAVVSVFISILIGIEAATLRRFALTRRGWKDVGIVSGGNLEEAERRFYDIWVRKRSAKRDEPTAPPPGTPPASLLPRVPQSPLSSGVIGSFPEPGAGR